MVDTLFISELMTERLMTERFKKKDMILGHIYGRHLDKDHIHHIFTIPVWYRFYRK